MSTALRRQMTVTAAVRKPPTPAGTPKLGGALTVVLPAIRCTPLDPVSAEVAQRLGLATPHEVLRCFVDGALDIREGYYLTVDGKNYPIRAVSDWTWRNTQFKELILEQLKR